MKKDLDINQLTGLSRSAETPSANAADQLECANIQDLRESKSQNNAKADSQISSELQNKCPIKDDLMTLIRDIQAMLI